MPALSGEYPFALDPFQVEALRAWERGESLLVAAPTGSGKTVIAEQAIDATLALGKRAFYTAPIKALSNQKFLDLSARLGAGRVGLLTGDNSINGDADVVVMTTEVLRNMIYARAHGLARLGMVVLDEVHFLQDAYRGPVWEEVIIHLPAAVRLVCLSATVSNATQVAEWLTTVRGPTAAIVEERRPVALEQWYAVADRTADKLYVLPTVIDGGLNNDAVRLDSEAARGPVRRGRRGSNGPSGRRRLQTPGRIEIVEHLADTRLLPAIYFIFSRAACDEAARSCLAAGLRLTEPGEQEAIAALVEERLGGLHDDDLEVLGYAQFLAQLQAGIAAHHAGMVPPFKEVVELAFARGLIKIVFATETLAVGVNMPARTVVIEKLTKYTGDHHTMLTPGEFTQLTGRAGRRGMDPVGHAVVLWSPFVTYEQVVNLVSSKSFHLRSAFRPTYNMAANLVRTTTPAEARHLLNLSFAQFQADREVVGAEARVARREAEHTRLRDEARSPYGDIDEYRHATSSRTPGTPRSAPRIDKALFALRPGQIIVAAKDRYVGRVAVISVAARNEGIRVTAVTTRGTTLHLRAGDFVEPPRVIGTIGLPAVYLPRAPEYQREVGEALRDATTERVTADDGDHDGDDAVTTAQGAARELHHPVEADPDLDRRLAAAVAADRLGREIADLRRRMGERNHSVAQDFDRVLGVLERWDYVREWTLTPAGKMLGRLFHESDLLIAECLRRGLLDGLDPPTMAALASVFVYEHRSPDEPPPAWFPSAEARRRWQRIDSLSAELADAERAAGLTEHRPPDPTFAAVAFAWAAGEAFAEVVEAEELSGGDFVRTTKQLIDLLRQIGQVAERSETRASARRATDALFRGIIEASSAIETEPDEDGSGG